MKKKYGILVLLIIVVLNQVNCQTNSNLRFEEVLRSHDCYEKFDSLFIQSLNIAIMAYPELHNVSIHFKEKKIRTIMAARPNFFNIFYNKEKRNYQILLSINELNHTDQLFCQMPEHALVGIVGHEMAHLLTYKDKNSIQLLFYAIKYLFNKKEIERETDMITISRGFGQALIAYNQFIASSNLVSKEYLTNRQNNYLSVNEIQENISR